ncbi:hypothetical protein LEJE111609_20370 [Lelliottia jeotgali]
MTATRQAAHHGHRIRINLLPPGRPRLITQIQTKTGVVLTGLALTLFCGQRDQGYRRIVQPESEGVRITLTFVLTKQSDFITVILLVRQLSAQLWQGRQPGLSAQVPSVGRAILIAVQVG